MCLTRKGSSRIRARCSGRASRICLLPSWAVVRPGWYRTPAQRGPVTQFSIGASMFSCGTAHSRSAAQSCGTVQQCGIIQWYNVFMNSISKILMKTENIKGGNFGRFSWAPLRRAPLGSAEKWGESSFGDCGEIVSGEFHGNLFESEPSGGWW